MKFHLPQIFWHGNRERIMSVDFGENLELISAGTDLSTSVFLRLWQIRLPDLRVEHLEDLAGTHERGVNIVRYSPRRSFIASGSDDACVLIWEKKKKPVFGEDRVVFGWGAKKVLRGHSREVHDIAWSNDEKMIASAGLDGNVIVFNVEIGRIVQRLEGSKPVHGIAWNDGVLACMSTDRCLRIYEQGKKGFYIKSCIKDFENIKLFQDEASSSAFFRKLEFSPDDLFLVTTSSQLKSTPCIHLFLYQHFTYPSLSFPVSLTEKATALAIRFCPVLFKSTKPSLFENQLFKTIWAVACKDSVILFSSEDEKPLAAVTNPHYSSITDLAWYEDLILAISSTDGYVSFLVFKEGELGERTEKVKNDEKERQKMEEVFDMDIDYEKTQNNQIVLMEDCENFKGLKENFDTAEGSGSFEGEVKGCDNLGEVGKIRVIGDGKNKRRIVPTALSGNWENDKSQTEN